MPLSQTYKAVKPAIVAFIAKYAHPDDPGHLPPIIGTGFLIRDDGLVMTNDHVIQAFREVYLPPGTPSSDWGVQALLWREINGQYLDLRIEIAGIARLGPVIMHTPPGRMAPDIGFVRLQVSNTPSLFITNKPIPCEGTTVATAGYALGRHALAAPGGNLQLGPTLQQGIISAVLPFPSARPSAFSVNIMAHGGGSGSPVFIPETGEVTGMLFSTLNDVSTLDHGTDTYRIPTTISYAVPPHQLQQACLHAPPAAPLSWPSLQELCDRRSHEK